MQLHILKIIHKTVRFSSCICACIKRIPMNFPDSSSKKKKKCVWCLIENMPCLQDELWQRRFKKLYRSKQQGSSSEDTDSVLRNPLCWNMQFAAAHEHTALDFKLHPALNCTGTKSGSWQCDHKNKEKAFVSWDRLFCFYRSLSSTVSFMMPIYVMFGNQNSFSSSNIYFIKKKKNTEVG